MGGSAEQIDKEKKNLICIQAFFTLIFVQMSYSSILAFIDSTRPGPDYNSYFKT